MNTWPTLLSEQTIEQDLSLLSHDNLQDYQYHLRTALKTAIHMISCYAEMAASNDSQLQRIVALENYFTRLWNKLEDTIGVTNTYAVMVKDEGVDMKKSYDDVLSKAIALVQALRSGKDITTEWLAQRDTFVAQARKLIDR